MRLNNEKKSILFCIVFDFHYFCAKISINQNNMIMKHLMRMGSLLAMMMLLTMGTMMISCGGDDVTGLPVLTKVSNR